MTDIFANWNCSDISLYQQNLTPDFLARAHAQGVRHFIPGWQSRQWARIQCNQILDHGGFNLAAHYAFPFWGRPNVTEKVQDAINGALEFGPKLVIYDCEYTEPVPGVIEGDAPWVTTLDRQRQLEQAINQIVNAGCEPAIYTGKYFWRDKMGDIQDYAALKLMHAAYYFDLSLELEVGYGGWRDVWCHQWMSTGTKYYIPEQQAFGTFPYFAGKSLDYCYLNPNYSGTPLEESMTPAERAEFDEVKSQLHAAIRVLCGNGLADPIAELARLDSHELDVNLYRYVDELNTAVTQHVDTVNAHTNAHLTAPGPVSTPVIVPITRES